MNHEAFDGTADAPRDPARRNFIERRDKIVLMTKVCTHGRSGAIAMQTLDLELYKSTKRYDGGVGRDQHGYPPSKELPY